MDTQTEVRDKNLNIRLTPSEMLDVVAAAGLVDRPASDYGRRLILADARKRITRAEKRDRESLAKHGDPRKESSAVGGDDGAERRSERPPGELRTGAPEPPEKGGAG